LNKLYLTAFSLQVVGLGLKLFYSSHILVFQAGVTSLLSTPPFFLSIGFQPLLLRGLLVSAIIE
jgi:hypothetical protein